MHVFVQWTIFNEDDDDDATQRQRTRKIQYFILLCFFFASFSVLSKDASIIDLVKSPKTTEQTCFLSIRMNCSWFYPVVQNDNEIKQQKKQLKCLFIVTQWNYAPPFKYTFKFRIKIIYWQHTWVNHIKSTIRAFRWLLKRIKISVRSLFLLRSLSIVRGTHKKTENQWKKSSVWILE